MKKARKNSRGKNRHTFYYKIGNRTIGHPVNVIEATQPVTILLKAEDVARSIKLQGAGNTMTCSMAVCAQRHANAFPHTVTGEIDWTATRCFVGSKIGKNGTMVECVAYQHNDDIAKINDTKGGQKKLLASLIANGDRMIRLVPPPKQIHRAPHPKGNRDGSRTAKPRPRGAHLRYAVASLGLTEWPSKDKAVS